MNKKNGTFIILILACIFLYKVINKAELNNMALLISILVFYYFYTNTSDEPQGFSEDLEDKDYLNSQIKNFISSIYELSIYNNTEYQQMLIYLNEFFRIYYLPNFEYCKYHVDTLELTKNKILNTLSSIIYRIPPEDELHNKMINEKTVELEDILSKYIFNFKEKCFNENTKNINTDSYITFNKYQYRAPAAVNFSTEEHYQVFN
jgi:hypothetical protein